MMRKLKHFDTPEHKLIRRVEIGQEARRSYGYRVIWKDGTASMWFGGYLTLAGAESAGKAW